MQEEPEYEEPPALPPRADDFLEMEPPPLPHRSADVEDEEGGEYEDLAEPPPAPAGLSLPTVKRQTVHTRHALKCQRFLRQVRTIMKT